MSQPIGAVSISSSPSMILYSQQRRATQSEHPIWTTTYPGTSSRHLAAVVSRGQLHSASNSSSTPLQYHHLFPIQHSVLINHRPPHPHHHYPPSAHPKSYHNYSAATDQHYHRDLWSSGSDFGRERHGNVPVMARSRVLSAGYARALAGSRRRRAFTRCSSVLASCISWQAIPTKKSVVRNIRARACACARPCTCSCVWIARPS
jgi:hypothetical protein